MTGYEDARTSTERVSSLEARMEALLGLVAEQATKIEVLEDRLAARSAAAPVPLTTRTLAPASAVPPAVDPIESAEAGPDGGAGMNRRRLLLGGGVAAAAAAAAVVATAGPAAAANGDSLRLGQVDNAATLPTTMTSTLGDGASALKVVSTGTGRVIEGVAGSGSDAVGVAGISTDGTGVYGQSNVTGVWGQSANEFGVYGSSVSSIGVWGQSDTNTGVVGISVPGVGVQAQSTTNTGLLATSASGRGASVTGGLANIQLPAYGTRSAPTGDAIEHAIGDIVTDASGNLWMCVAGGTPGTWRKLAGPASAGTFHLLPNAVRVYDSRPGTSPAVGSKTPLSGNTARLLSVTANSSGVPLGATAISATLLLLNASSAGGNFTIWAGGAPRPSANAMVWGGTAGRFASTAISRISADGKVNVAASASADLALDIVGYYL